MGVHDRSLPGLGKQRARCHGQSRTPERRSCSSLLGLVPREPLALPLGHQDPLGRLLVHHRPRGARALPPARGLDGGVCELQPRRRQGEDPPRAAGLRGDAAGLPEEAGGRLEDGAGLRAHPQGRPHLADPVGPLEAAARQEGRHRPRRARALHERPPSLHGLDGAHPALILRSSCARTGSSPA